MYTKDDLEKMVEKIDQDNELQLYDEGGPYPARITSCNDAERQSKFLHNQRANKALNDALRDMRREQAQSFSDINHDLNPKM